MGHGPKIKSADASSSGTQSLGAGADEEDRLSVCSGSTFGTLTRSIESGKTFLSCPRVLSVVVLFALVFKVNLLGEYYSFHILYPKHLTMMSFDVYVSF